MKKAHYYEIDFIRLFCALGIIIYHFSCYSNSYIRDRLYFGSLIVSVFFLVSGFVLYANNKKIVSLKNYYYKRFKSIYPLFWIIWFVFYVMNVIKVRTPFYAGNPIKLVLSVFAIDGYFSQRIVNYYTVGEWFLGALIFVYILYPLIVKMMDKNPFIPAILFGCLFEAIRIFNLPVISPGFPSISECCLIVYIGMILNKYWNNVYNKYAIFSSLIVFAGIVVVTPPYTSIENELKIIMSVCMFILLFFIGSLLEESKFMTNLLHVSGKLTYPVFLLQHQIILIVTLFFNPSDTVLAVVCLIICICLIFGLAYIFNLVIKTVLDSNVYKSFEKKVLN